MVLACIDQQELGLSTHLVFVCIALVALQVAPGRIDQEVLQEAYIVQEVLG